MVAPSVPRVVRELFGVADDGIECSGLRVRARQNGESREYDVVTRFPGHAPITECKATLRSEDVGEFV